jgi:CheY-like chemotaxis protein
MHFGVFNNVSNHKTILVIEDEDSLCEVLQDELSCHGYKVSIAHDGIEGLEMIQDLEPDLIICDRAMPAMTGYELLERLRGIYPQYQNVPFIFLTALSHPRDKQAVEPLKPTAYLEKPLDFDKLYKIIQENIA